MYGFAVLKERSDWLVRLRCNEGAFRLACTALLSLRSDPIGWYGFAVLKERSDWLVRLRCPDDLICRPGDLSSSALMYFLFYKLQTVVSQKTRKRYAKCVLFCNNFPFALPLRIKQTNDRLFLYITYSILWGNVTVHYALLWSLVSDDS